MKISILPRGGWNQPEESHKQHDEEEEEEPGQEQRVDIDRLVK